MVFIEYDDAGRNSGAVKEVGGQTDNAFDIALLQDILTDLAFGISAEEYAVRQNHGSFPCGFQRLDNV